MGRETKKEISGKNLITKRALMEALKKLMEEKPFQTITVSEITDQCGLSRLTFYYHFQDKYALLNWMCVVEVVEPFQENLTLLNWDKKLLEALTFMKKNQRYYRQILTNDDSELKEFIFHVTADILQRGVEELKKEGLVSEEDKKFITYFFSDGVIGTITRWAESGMRETPQKVASRMKALVEDSKSIIISRYLDEESEVH